MTKDRIKEILLKYQGIDGRSTTKLNPEYLSCLGRVVGEDVSIKSEESFGGYEGAGDETWFVLSIEFEENKQKVYVKFSGYYSSWDDTQWKKDFDVVEPVEYVAIRWDKVKE